MKHFTVLPTLQGEDAHGGPKLSGNSACLCSPASTILQHLCSLIVSSWHRMCYSDHPSGHCPLLSTMGFSQERSFPRPTSIHRPSAQWHAEGLAKPWHVLPLHSSWKSNWWLWNCCLGQEVWGKLLSCLYPYICSAEVHFWKMFCLGFFPVAVRWVIRGLAGLSILNFRRKLEES